MSRTDRRTTTRELKLALQRKETDPNAERDRRNWGTWAKRQTVRVFKKHNNPKNRYKGKTEITCDEQR